MLAGQVELEDNGPSIPNSERQKVFERFYRMSGQEGKGSELGLAIVQEIVWVHNAELFIEQGTEQKGTSPLMTFIKVSITFE